ncbi:unnamed protein product [Brassica rapa subsp. trilocularis]
MQKKTCLEPLGTNNGVSGCLINVRHRYLNLQSRLFFNSYLNNFVIWLRSCYAGAGICSFLILSPSKRKVLLMSGTKNVSGQTAKWVSSREAAELSGGSDRGTRQKASEKTVKTEDGVLGEFHGSTKASRRPMVERSPSSTSLERRFINNQSSARWGSEVEETGLRNNVKDFSAPEDERFRVDDTSQGNISFNNKAYLRKCH